MARNDTSRGLRDEARVGPAPRPARELKRLSELRYQVADGEPDIRGWTVYSSTGREYGQVEDLLVDTDAGEVVMVDVDLRRDDRHALVPIRAAWIDHGTRRVVVEAKELAADESLPGLPRSGTLSDDDVDRFDAGYARAYGDRGLDRDHAWRLRRGDEELRFGGQRERAGEPWDGRTTVGAAGAAALGAGAAHLAHDDRHERDRHERELRGAELRDAERRQAALEGRSAHDEDRMAEPKRLMDPTPATAMPSPQPPAAEGAYFEESRRIDAIMDDGTTGAGERRAARVDDASTLDDAQAITPQELDARVRLDEGGRVDDRTPVAGVTYDAGTAPAHGYGRPDERYGPEYGSGRIGFDRVVSRHRWSDDAAGRESTPDDVARPLPPGAERPHGDPLRAQVVDDHSASGTAVTGNALADRDRDGVPDRADAHDDRGVLERARDAVSRAADRVRGDEGDASARRDVRYRRYEDRYEGR